jgi:hypothetical protein
MMNTATVIGGLVLASLAFPALADTAALETLRSECAAQLKLPPAACNCIVDRAAALNDNQQAFVAASVTKDEATAATLRGQMTIEELTQAGMFMTTSPQACARGG